MNTETISSRYYPAKVPTICLVIPSVYYIQDMKVILLAFDTYFRVCIFQFFHSYIYIIYSAFIIPSYLETIRTLSVLKCYYASMMLMQLLYDLYNCYYF